MSHFCRTSSNSFFQTGATGPQNYVGYTLCAKFLHFVALDYPVTFFFYIFLFLFFSFFLLHLLIIDIVIFIYFFQVHRFTLSLILLVIITLVIFTLSSTLALPRTPSYFFSHYPIFDAFLLYYCHSKLTYSLRAVTSRSGAVACHRKPVIRDVKRSVENIVYLCAYIIAQLFDSSACIIFLLF